MAGDWIPCEVGLFRKNEILAIARKTKRSRHDVGGLLLEFWGWCSNESVDGRIRDVGIDMLPDIIGGDRRFWQAVIDAGWLIENESGLTVPNADRWISRGAKARLMSARRKQKQRIGEVRTSRTERDDGHAGSVTGHARTVTKSVTTEQNSREQRSKYHPACEEEEGIGTASASSADPVANPSPDLIEAAAVCRGHAYLARMLDPTLVLNRLRVAHPDLDLVRTVRLAAARLTPERVVEQERRRKGPDGFLAHFFANADRDRIAGGKTEPAGGGMHDRVSALVAEHERIEREARERDEREAAEARRAGSGGGQ